MQTNPLFGVLFHAIGSASSSSCYTPQKKTQQWSWEVYWVSQACFAWLILPILGAFLTIPNYLDVVASVPSSVMLKSFGLGALYGVGGLTFGLGIRYIGFSLNYAIAIGLSAALGTLSINLESKRRFRLGDCREVFEWPGFGSSGGDTGFTIRYICLRLGGCVAQARQRGTSNQIQSPNWHSPGDDGRRFVGRVQLLAACRRTAGSCGRPTRCQ